MFDRINDYSAVSLEEIKAIKLMNRVDTKYVVAAETMTRILDELVDDYSVLEIASQRFGKYRTKYYDTVDFSMYHAHVTTRNPRYKVRKRSYSQNGMKFLEVKHKRPNGRTSKIRLPQENETGLDGKFVANHSPFCADELYPVLFNDFNRITLVNRERTERVTIDFDLQFHTIDNVATPVFKNVAIVELKQDKKTESVISKRLKHENIHPNGISKYCVGILLTNNNISYKMYKTKFFNFLKIAQWT